MSLRDEWIELADPDSGRQVFANLATGECSWLRPITGPVKPRNPAGEYWELFDETHELPYYYNTLTGDTTWVAPDSPDVVIVPLHALQRSVLGNHMSMLVSSRASVMLAGELLASLPNVPGSIGLDTSVSNGGGSGSGGGGASGGGGGNSVMPLLPSLSASASASSTVAVPSDPSTATSSSETMPQPFQQQQQHQQQHQQQQKQHQQQHQYQQQQQQKRKLSHSPSMPDTKVAAINTTPASTFTGPLSPITSSTASLPGSGQQQQLTAVTNGNGVARHQIDASALMTPPLEPQSPASPLITAQLNASDSAFGDSRTIGELLTADENIRLPARATPAAISAKSTKFGSASAAHLPTRNIISHSVTQFNDSAQSQASPTTTNMTVNSRPSMQLVRAANIDVNPATATATATAMSQLPQSPQSPLLPPQLQRPMTSAGISSNPDGQMQQALRKASASRHILIPDESTLKRSASRGAMKRYTVTEEMKRDISQTPFESFAESHYARRTQGLFLLRRQVPVEKLLVWTWMPMRQPLLPLPRGMKKDAVKAFVVIQTVMGDRPQRSGQSLWQSIEWLVSTAIRTPALRDEVYCQLCRQLRSNPSSQSAHKGWRLMCVFASAFPPSKELECYLKNFVERHFETYTDQIDQCAQFSFSRLMRICTTGPQSASPSTREIERAFNSPLALSVFGESLDLLMRMPSVPDEELGVPRVLSFLVTAVLMLNGHRTEGIFRIPGDVSLVTALRTRIDEGKYDLAGVKDPNVPASLLKAWFREMAEPLIPTEWYNDSISLAANSKHVVTVIKRLEGIRLRVVDYVTQFLQVLARPENVVQTKMNVSNLAVVFAPSYLRCPAENKADIFANTTAEQSFVKTLIQSWHGSPVPTQQ
ncbi:hypothetical protein GQ42DRAFT_161225 [Ramicandelaber brevisporus]|nr:hypothetical protein GQ42DRAFT_161225 [Ramicandelaber brevisporus]